MFYVACDSFLGQTRCAIRPFQLSRHFVGLLPAFADNSHSLCVTCANIVLCSSTAIWVLRMEVSGWHPGLVLKDVFWQFFQMMS